jgi:hypothetical protein
MFMARKPKDRGGRRRRSAITATIEAATDSSERVGADAAIYIFLIVLSFSALTLRADPIYVAVLDFIFGVGWNANRYFKDSYKERKAWVSLERLKQTRGYGLLQLFIKTPKQLSLLRGDDNDNVRQR